MQSPTVRVGKPDRMISYDKKNVEGIEVYLTKKARKGRQIRVKLRGFWIFKYLDVEGMRS